MKELIGRRCLVQQTALTPQLRREAKLLPAMDKNGTEIRCLRCNTVHQAAEVQLPSGAYYCPACIQLGRVSSDQVFVTGPALQPRSQKVVFAWQGQLSPAQTAASRQVKRCINRRQHLLLWAVTGAGKTEILFAGLYQALAAGQRVALASPRIDVCRELYSRLQKVFPASRLLLLYGRSQEGYRYADFTICTTHQLLRFYRAFDVLIVDEVDAFPYAGDPKLAYGAKTALKKQGVMVYLSATVSAQLLQELQGRFLIYKIPARYHRRPLPEPRLRWWDRWQQKAVAGRHLRVLLQEIRHLVAQDRILLFCPSIFLMNHLFSHLQRQLPGLKIMAVSAVDPQREMIVEQMRCQGYDILLTTTILERGVTFEEISVLVLGANHRVFSREVLVQIAGRVDRKGAVRRGEVVFVYDEMTAALKAACREIQALNQLAGKRGLLDEM